MSNNTKYDDFEITYNGVSYWVSVKFETCLEDYSYNGDKFGGFYVFEDYRKSVDEESVEVVEIESDKDYAIDPYDVDKSFYSAITEVLKDRFNQHNQ